MTKFREFKVGDNVKILADRIEDWQPKEALTVAMVRPNHKSQIEATGHPQTLIMTNGRVYSGWWFDPASICLWARKPETIG
jgi:hypothetical protein